MNNLRFEGEVSYQNNDGDTWTPPVGPSVPETEETTALTFLVNGYLDFNTGGPWTPYITAGIGASEIELSDPGYELDDTVFAYQIGAGVGYAMSDRITLDFKYRYLATTDPEYTDPNGNKWDTEFSSHNLTIGLRMSFE